MTRRPPCQRPCLWSMKNTRELTVSALREASLEAVGFEDPIAALDWMRSTPVLRSACWLRV